MKPSISRPSSLFGRGVCVSVTRHSYVFSFRPKKGGKRGGGRSRLCTLPFLLPFPPHEIVNRQKSLEEGKGEEGGLQGPFSSSGGTEEKIGKRRAQGFAAADLYKTTGNSIMRKEKCGTRNHFRGTESVLFLSWGDMPAWHLDFLLPPSSSFAACRLTPPPPDDAHGGKGDEIGEEEFLSAASLLFHRKGAVCGHVRR